MSDKKEWKDKDDHKLMMTMLELLDKTMNLAELLPPDQNVIDKHLSIILAFKDFAAAMIKFHDKHIGSQNLKPFDFEKAKSKNEE
jgi:hypothetical protein